MKCPLLRQAALAREAPRYVVDTDCIKNDCAWYDPDLELCAVRQIGVGVQLLAQLPEEIKQVITDTNKVRL